MNVKALRRTAALLRNGAGCEGLAADQLDSAASEIERLLAITPDRLSSAARDVLAERRRQIEVEGWTPEHDDRHEDGDMARAAACYALHAAGYPADDVAMLRFWPWLDEWWKPSTPTRNLVKACALGIAEIERRYRSEAANDKPTPMEVKQ
jgi:hypothetical protein